ncbi:hypothetical protein Aam_009_015 [Acidocella aminolytica 101 = DSM 11237]|uniref:Uncharacterized protein n=1 Tax=Acidocella aminolytica 101 = DSM 11237 TaxID=1120923 RepID=A0A0D6PAY1_9PROT|nr:hypothetical protein Aam_009_015 [Acidocella aminolytica 101 = DSM 11237]
MLPHQFRQPVAGRFQKEPVSVQNNALVGEFDNGETVAYGTEGLGVLDEFERVWSKHGYGLFPHMILSG